MGSPMKKLSLGDYKGIMSIMGSNLYMLHNKKEEKKTIGNDTGLAPKKNVGRKE
jgi:hypothetical protein